MTKLAKAKNYVRIQRWVDRDLISYPRTASHMLGFAPVLAALFSDLLLDGPVMRGVWAVAISLGAAWTLFVFWRAARLLKAASIKGDRQFDQKAKFLLPPEYHRSESVTAASQRGRKRRRSARR